MSEDETPYRIWNLETPFNKHGFPVMGSFGRTVEQVVVMKVETFQRLVREHPTLGTAKFEVGEFVDA